MIEINRKWLISIRESKKYSQKEIAEACGITEGMVSLIESGKRNPSIETAMSIGKFLRFDWTMFFVE